MSCLDESSSPQMVTAVSWTPLFSLPESGITLTAKDFLECQNQTVKENIIFLAVDSNLQGNIYFLQVEVNRQGIWVFPWRFLITSKEMIYFLECNCKL